MRIRGRIVVETSLFVLTILFLAMGMGCSSTDNSRQYFDDADSESLQHLSNALVAFFELTQVAEEDWEEIIALANTVYSECDKIADSTLNKIEQEFKKQLRDNLQSGAHLFAKGMRALLDQKKKGIEAYSQAQSDMRSGHQLMLNFHQYYNANIEEIVEKLRRHGLKLIG